MTSLHARSLHTTLRYQAFRDSASKQRSFTFARMGGEQPVENAGNLAAQQSGAKGNFVPPPDTSAPVQGLADPPNPAAFAPGCAFVIAVSTFCSPEVVRRKCDNCLSACQSPHALQCLPTHVLTLAITPKLVLTSASINSFYSWVDVILVPVIDQTWMAFGVEISLQIFVIIWMYSSLSRDR